LLSIHLIIDLAAIATAKIENATTIAIAKLEEQ